MILLAFLASAVSTALVDNLLAMSLLGGAQQLAQAPVWTTIGIVACEAFPTNCRGFFSGLLYAFCAVFMIMSPIVGGYLFDRHLGMECILLYAGVSLAGCLPALLVKPAEPGAHLGSR